MLISLEWLNEYIDLKDKTPDEVITTLTDLGLEVEGVEKRPPLSDAVVVGEILTAEKHPNADALQICTVNVGTATPLTIVCGAANARVGLKAAVAQIGAVLPGNFEIKPTKIRGQASEGMMCSQKELQLSEQDQGLWELSPSLVPGTKVSGIIRTEDTILEVSLTPNRADCLSYVGIARDLSARYSIPLKMPKREKIAYAVEPSERHIAVTVEDSEACTRFCALHIAEVQPTPSPLWMQRRLTVSGMRPINLIVDATNYVLLEYGQPVHAYDYRDLSGNTIAVRSALINDKLKTLDDQDLKLKPRDILICDSKNPIGLAGIMGGKNSEIKEDTSTIIVEVAEFHPLQIRRTAKRLGLHTEASHRFERGVDVENLPAVAMRVGELLSRAARELGIPEPRVAKGVVDIYPSPVAKKSIALRLKRIRQVLGLPLLTINTCVNRLNALGFVLLDSTEQRMLFEVPTWRQDMAREIDLIEEVARLEGFDKIPYEMPTMEIAPTPESPTIAFIDDLKLTLAGLGMTEIITFPFTSGQAVEAIGISAGHPLFPTLCLANPLSEEMNYLQTTLVPGLLEAVSNNRNQGRKGARLFEIGRGYFDLKNHPFDVTAYPTFRAYLRPSSHYSERARTEINRPTERQLVAGILDFPFTQKSWAQEEVGISFFHVKEIVYSLCKPFGIPSGNISLERPVPRELPFLHPGASAVLIFNDRILGWIGELHPKAAVELGFGADKIPCIFELDIDFLLEASLQRMAIASSLSKFPPVTRDIALLAERTVSHRDFEKCFTTFPKKNYLCSAKLFDVYEGDKIPMTQHSYAYTLSFQSPDKTLTDKEVDLELGQLLDWVKKTVDATQR